MMKTNLDISNTYYVKSRNGRQGVVLILVALSVFVIIGIMGLAVDLSRF